MCRHEKCLALVEKHWKCSQQAENCVKFKWQSSTWVENKRKRVNWRNKKNYISWKSCKLSCLDVWPPKHDNLNHTIADIECENHVTMLHLSFSVFRFNDSLSPVTGTFTNWTNRNNKTTQMSQSSTICISTFVNWAFIISLVHMGPESHPHILIMVTQFNTANWTLTRYMMLLWCVCKEEHFSCDYSWCALLVTKAMLLKLSVSYM